MQAGSLDESMLCNRWTDGSNLGELISGFDQEAAAVLTARLCTFKMQTVRFLPHDSAVVLSWLISAISTAAFAHGPCMLDCMIT